MASKSFVLFITGTSASGKTTLYESLRQDSALKDLEFHDIDENGVPPVGRVAWRKFRVEELLYQAVTQLDKNVSTIICGISKPHEVIESLYFKPDANIHFLLVEVPFAIVAERIKKRADEQSKSAAFDEVFNPDALEEILLASKKLLRELQNSVSQQKNGHVLDVSRLSKQQTHDKAVSLIAKISS